MTCSKDKSRMILFGINIVSCLGVIFALMRKKRMKKIMNRAVPAEINLIVISTILILIPEKEGVKKDLRLKIGLWVTNAKEEDLKNKLFSDQKITVKKMKNKKLHERKNK